jgi:hypothetical protein
MTSRDALYLALAQTPDDWLLRAVLADSFEESGQQVVADCVRWMIQHHKRPYRSPDGYFHWFDAHRIRNRVDPESDIPEEIYRHLTGSIGTWAIYRTYDNLRAAEEDFHVAWQHARAGGWTGHV